MGPWVTRGVAVRTGPPLPQGGTFPGHEVPALFSCLRLQQLDEENGELRSCTPCLKANIERLEEVSGQLGARSVWGPAP